MLLLPPDVPAIDARLEVIAPDRGSRRQLAEIQSEWVLLTFVAPWCANCEESLEMLMALEDLAALRVVVVVPDGDEAWASERAAENGSSYDVLVDVQRTAQGDGQADVQADVQADESSSLAELYGAVGLPVSFLVRAPGTVVGILRGARDWNQLRPALESLLGESPSGDAVWGDRPLGLLEQMRTPSVSVSSAPKSVRLGEAFAVGIRLEWPGEFADVVPQVPEISLPEGVERLDTAARSSDEGGRGSVEYTVNLRSDVAGELTLSPIVANYTPRLEMTALSTRAPGPVVLVRPGGLSRWLWLGLLVPLGLVFAVLLRRFRSPSSPDQGESTVDGQALLDRARRHRLDGETEPALGLLGTLAEELAKTDEDARSALGEIALLTEQVRFAGRVPGGDELDRIHRVLERAHNRRRPADLTAEKEALNIND